MSPFPSRHSLTHSSPVCLSVCLLVTYTILVTLPVAVAVLVPMLPLLLCWGTPGFGSVDASAGGRLMNCGMNCGSLVMTPSRYWYCW